MREWEMPLVIIGLFVLRCLVPALLVLFIGYSMNKLSDRLKIQEEARRAAALALAALTGPTWEGKDCETPANCKAFFSPVFPAWLTKQWVCGCRRPDECLCSPFYHSVPV